MAKKGLGDIQSHINSLRVKVKGEGNLQAFLFNDGTEDNSELFPQPMSMSSAQSVNFLSDFTAERICILLITTEFEEKFEISNIWAYVKPSRISFPQV